MGAQTLTIKIKGRYTHPSELAEVPDGALTECNNLNIDEESVATPRRGLDREGYVFSATNTHRTNKIFEYEDKKIVHYSTNSLAYDTGSAYTAYSGTYDPPDASNPVRSAQSNENFYFTTDQGVYKLDGATDTPVLSGAAKGLTLEASTTGSSGFLSTGNSVGYRLVWGFKDANNNLILGAPSERAVITNNSGSNAVDGSITATIPSTVTTEYIYQLYRSAQTTGTPSDEMQLVYEDNPTSGEISAGTLTFTDSTPDALVGATIYTAPSQETIAYANETPPLAKDITVWNDHVWFANTQTKHRLTLTCLSADGTSVSPVTSLKYDDIITINGVAYTGKASTTVANDEFKVFSAGSVSQNIEDTCKELCKVINQSTSNTGDDAIYAYYVSGESDTPGQMLFESRNVGGSQFSVTFTPQVAGASPWDPRLPTSGSTVVSSNDAYKNGLSFSKSQQPEAVPLPNQFRVGSADDEIKRVLPLRDSLFVLTEGGVYRVTGENSSSFRVDLFDNTAKIIGAETAVVLNNAIYFLSDQGVVQCTETGISVVSRPIEIDFVELVGQARTAVESYAFAVGYETERKYILGVPDTSSDTSAVTYHVYNTFTNSWTTWDGFSSQSAFVNPVDDKLYFADASSNYLLQERKSFSDTDYGDFNVAVTLSSVDNDALTLVSTQADSITKGDVIWQSDTVWSIVNSVDSVTGICTMEFNGGLTNAAATVYSAIDCSLKFAPIHGGNPSIMKHFREVAFLFKQNFSIDVNFGFESDFSADNEQLTVTGNAYGNWGFFSWGEIAWGGVRNRKPFRRIVPRNKQRCTQLIVDFAHRIGFSAFKLNGMAAHYEPVSERFEW